MKRVTVVAATTTLVLRVDVIEHPVPCHYDFMCPLRFVHCTLSRGVVAAAAGVVGAELWKGLSLAWEAGEGCLRQAGDNFKIAKSRCVPDWIVFVTVIH